MCHPEPTPKKISNLVPIGFSTENYDNLSVRGRKPDSLNYFEISALMTIFGKFFKE